MTSALHAPALGLRTRRYLPSDYPNLRAAMQEAYAGLGGDVPDEAELARLHALYPDGQLVVTVGGRFAGATLSRVVPFATYRRHHTIAERLDPSRYRDDAATGETVYVLDVFVPTAFRLQNVGRLCAAAVRAQAFADNAARVIGVSPIPGYRAHAAELDADSYVARVRGGQLTDPALSFQFALGATDFGVFPGYNMGDLPSCGYGVGVTVVNPTYDPSRRFASQTLGRSG